MFRILVFSLLVTILSCERGDDSLSSPSLSVRLGAGRCEKKPSQMKWLQDLIVNSKSDPALMGNIYAGEYEGQVVFIHQPMVMSCLACVIYDCDGNKLDMSTLNHEKLRVLMDDWHLIYQPY